MPDNLCDTRKPGIAVIATEKALNKCLLLTIHSDRDVALFLRSFP